MPSSATTWLPLESNPDVLNKYIRKLGVPSEWSVVDVFGLDDDQLEWIPKPVKSIILLFPCSDAYEKHREEENAELKANPPQVPDDLFYMKQVIHNACGTIALVHGIANSNIKLNEGVLKNYLDKAQTLTPDARGTMLEADTAFTDSHQEIAQEGQTEPPNADDKINHHYIALIQKDGTLYELDGRKSFPIDHGKTNEDDFLRDSAKICKSFMNRDPEEVRFTVMALAHTQD